MVKFLKPGKVVIILSGRYAGKKAVIVKNFDDGVGNKKYGAALVAGVRRPPLGITRSMGKKKVARRTRVKPFVKLVNFNHIMPTRYTLEIDLKSVVTTDSVTNPTAKDTAMKEVKKQFEERYKSGKSAWFFQKLRF
eukprot:TRINITY_DN5170_c0_g1::TRINITY_DN5170_c0_g1_i1::g.29383::m.29383 TRINITY_DN5170_c0_g1::TRINITY_DN5170_c0_g1_i1::g.29383  ORF type:complete len:150 (+),score=56.05,sp/O14388/RL27A_SCHPO/59.56/4e-53,Ribosomal_L27e/PF01777.13/3.2e+03,Ribosomal_L27e/PF01777.13/2.6e-35,KOW/PF00467.24/1.3e-06,PRP3/PF08572.5/0.098 TRINITY_DN5170_c0_g1_i1:44-451(+)